MPMDESQAVQNYEDGINEVGIDAYRRASQENTASGAASILEDAKRDQMDASSFADAYREGY